MTATLEVKNFARFQHYRDRNPPWIKLYTSLLSDVTFVGLPEVTRYHLVALWIVASRSDGLLPDDPRVLSRLIAADTVVDVNELVRSGFLLRKEGAMPLLAPSGQGAPVLLCPENREQSINNDNYRAREAWLTSFSETDRAAVVEFLDGMSDHQAYVWGRRIAGYLDGLDMPGGKRAAPAAVATAIRDLDGGDATPARFRRFVERAMTDAANPITAKTPLPPGRSGGITAKLAAIGRKGQGNATR